MEIYEQQPWEFFKDRRYFIFGDEIQDQLNKSYKSLEKGKTKDETLKIKNELYYVSQLCVGQTKFALKKAGDLQNSYEVIRKENSRLPIIQVESQDLVFNIGNKKYKVPEAWRISQMRTQAFKSK